MQITPIVRHAQAHLPKLTNAFSDTLTVTSMDVVLGGTSTLSLGAAHGLETGVSHAVVITAATTANPITAAVVNADDSVTVTTQYDHDLTTTPNILRADPWDTKVTLSGFTSADLNATLDLVSVTDRKTFTVTPTNPVASIVLNTNEAMVADVLSEVGGWYTMLAVDATTLTFDTPTAVTRSYTVTAPEVSTGMRVFGSLDIEEIVRQYVRDDNSAIPAVKPVMYITPVAVTASRSKYSGTDMISDGSGNTDNRLPYQDGFDVFVIIPCEHSASGVAAIDQAQGDVLNAVLGTFFGFKAKRPEFCTTQEYISIMSGHQGVAYTKANYTHRYSFISQFIIGNGDAISPLDITEQDGSTGGTLPTELLPVGAPPIHDIAPLGITHDKKPGKLTANIKLDE